LPRTTTGIVVALADKLEILLGLFGIGQLPSGDKDPFALRRHALGVLRMLAERLPTLALDAALDTALSAPTWPPAWHRLVATPESAVAPVRDLLLQFFRDRLAVATREQGYSALEVEAVLADDKFWWLAEVTPRLAAVREFAAMPQAAALAAANKRVGNILKKSAAVDVAQVDSALLIEPAERALHVALQDMSPSAAVAFERRDYTAVLTALAALREPVDAFFDAVMVNAEDPKLRANRLALLKALSLAMNRVADLSKLAA
jgi:glycyl-tRNA synthetase beta chain